MRYRGKMYTKREALALCGNISKLAGVRTYVFDEGKPKGIRLHEVTAGDMQFSVMESRCMDLLDLRYKGVPLNFLSAAGPVNAGLADPVGKNFLRSITGGMLYTCGTGNVGAPYIEGDEREYFHGQIRFAPAEHTAVSAGWQGDEYRIELRGEMRENGLFMPDVCLQRTISTDVGEKVIAIRDRYENQSPKQAPLMLMYHINSGFPLLGEGAQVYIPAALTEAQNDEAHIKKDQWGTIEHPSDDADECVWLHRMKRNSQGFSHCAVYNPKEDLGLAIRFRTEELPYLVQWKSMCSNSYALGLQPANCHGAGRGFEMEHGGPRTLQPYETVETDLQIRVLDGKDDLGLFLENYNACCL